MPPKAKVTKDMVVDAAVEVARQQGVQSINARTVASQLGCSTQPVMYHFSTIDELRRAAYAKADALHSAYLMQGSPDVDPLLSIGLSYIRFAKEEPLLFRFLFQSDYAQKNGLLETIEAPELVPVLDVVQQKAALDRAQIKEIFLIVALFAHGCASLIANGAIEYDESPIAANLERCFVGAVAAVSKESQR